MAVAAPAAGTDKPRRFRWKRLLAVVALVVVIGAAANLLGWDLRGWFSDLWDTLTGISTAYLVAAIVLKTVQTLATGYAWYAILRFAYGERVRRREILACYAAAVALNSILPANLGTLAMLLMFTSIIAGVTFAAVLGGYAVQKIFFTLIGAFTYLYLFLTIGGSFDIKFAFFHEHPWSIVLLLLGSAVLIYLVIRRLWPRILRWWADAKDGGAILVHPRAYFGRVFLPSFIGWVASLGVMAVFLAAYDIPVSFDTLMRICAGNSIANVTSVTPGGAGVTQAFNVASLHGIASTQDATAYSVAQQLVTTAWNIVLGIAMMVFAFGWSGGKGLVTESYHGAKEKVAEQKAAHDAKKAEKQRAEAAGES
jgi:uncharacterized membrane protein YbhN (UPF0104 family)